MIRPDGSGLKRIVADGADPAWSADGTRIAFTRYTTGKGFAVYVANRAGQGQRAVVEGSSPAWSPDGKRLAFVTPFGQIAVVSTRGGRVKQLTKKGTAADHVDW